MTAGIPSLSSRPRAGGTKAGPTLLLVRAHPVPSQSRGNPRHSGSRGLSGSNLEDIRRRRETRPGTKRKAEGQKGKRENAKGEGRRSKAQIVLHCATCHGDRDHQTWEYGNCGKTSRFTWIESRKAKRSPSQSTALPSRCSGRSSPQRQCCLALSPRVVPRLRDEPFATGAARSISSWQSPCQKSSTSFVTSGSDAGYGVHRFICALEAGCA